MRFFGFLLRVVGYFVLGICLMMLLSILLVVFVLVLGAASVSSVLAWPATQLLLSNGVQEGLLWTGIILTFGIPLLAIIAFLVRAVVGKKRKSRSFGIGLLVLWLVGFLCFAGLVFSLKQDFNATYQAEQNFNLLQPKRELVLKKESFNRSSFPTKGSLFFFNWNGMDYGSYMDFDEDTLFLKSISIHTEESPDSNYYVKLKLLSNGKKERQAQKYVQQMNFTLRQEDSILYIPNGFSIYHSPFRNQRAYIQIEVPKNKMVDFQDGLEQWKDRNFEIFFRRGETGR